MYTVTLDLAFHQTNALMILRPGKLFAPFGSGSWSMLSWAGDGVTQWVRLLQS